MILPSRQDAIHKAWLYRLLTAIVDEPRLAVVLAFKGGTAAAMLGWLDRFSIDLDFDYIGDKKDMTTTRELLEKVFRDLGLEIKDASKQVPQYFLRYPTAAEHMRNTIKVDVTFPPPQANAYETFRLIDIDRMVRCQTAETMFANKLVAVLDRFAKHHSIAGRDIYDIHAFYLKGCTYNEKVILERRSIATAGPFFQELITFIEKEITTQVLQEDLNMLLPPEVFKKCEKILKPEVLQFLRGEIEGTL
ncbi:MAG: hypothetical protein A3F54_02620 [Candidatus Kerfeldbacteria bacterium RIFCSPHIGHO2_12_FULL_48_17]|uniref:Nucleotidyl transferase AbiEii/AbiGii toxin family protein n=1 Tax=Candidatus Kerfeldbacteria bacterium RIFCSPHIGHO2_12_FULL_48_17 TaxID=1798542 RepID=A0A1G2AX48_9BACT|nr:MAG: hypothetical protein A3F54_02620 [Candidatus Kerfeldbacteria bacterium RIFCSPHIGHO2_12_FULL_48_17]